MMRCDSGLEVLPCNVMAGTGEQDVLDGVEVEWGRLPAGVECTRGVLHLTELAVSAELSVSAVGSDASSDPHHWAALCAEVQR